MQKLKLLFTRYNFTNLLICSVFLSLLSFSLYLLPKTASAAVPGGATSDAFPKLHLNCTSTRDPEFQSLRPYQAAPCGDAPKARYCSNTLKFIEDIDVTSQCDRRGSRGIWVCDGFDVHVLPHNLYVTLDQSQFPIMGNTEDVINHANGSDSIDDATKVNEYVSWYLNGITDKAEKKESTDDEIINLSGPVKKLLPSVMQDVARIKTIESATKISEYYDEDLKKDVRDAENHDQIVVDHLRLSSWGDGDLSLLNTFFNWLGTDIWNKKYPPLPWQFKEPILFQKAYNEWKGKNCAILPKIGLACVDTPVSDKWAEQWRFVPLANTTDKKGANYLVTVDGPSYDAANGTEIYDAQHEAYTNAPLYFAHTQEVMDLSEQLNKTYLPSKYKSQKVSETTEINDCSSLVVRSNKGDNLFPGDDVEISVTGAEYHITSGLCEEKEGHWDTKKIDGVWEDVWVEGSFKCNSEVAIILRLGTKTPFANELFANIVADSGSSFRKIYPQVGPGAPVSCIADIPTTTTVTYDPAGSELPRSDVGTGTQEFKVVRYPEDSGGETPELTFPHIGSIYEYFLKSIQTALRPQGYGNEQPANGQNCTASCGELPKGLPKASGSCALGSPSVQVGAIPQSLREIVNAAAQTYKTPPGLILGIMYGEGLFEKGRFNWTDNNVKNWATCEKIPNCNETGDDNFMGFNGTVFERIVPKIQKDLQKVDPSRKKFSQCNLLDSIYAISYNLHASAAGGGGLPATCFGISLNSTIPTSCSWNDSQYESAIKVSESGYTSACLTKEGSCLTGGGLDAACATGDTCETKDVRYLNPSHNACVWDAAHGTGAGRR